MNAYQLEILIEQFKALNKDMPAGYLKRTHPPYADYLLTTEKKTIGIELTEAFQSEESQRASMTS